MPNEFIIKNGFRSQGNSEITGSLRASSVNVPTVAEAGTSANITSTGTGTGFGFFSSTMHFTDGTNRIFGGGNAYSNLGFVVGANAFLGWRRTGYILNGIQNTETRLYSDANDTIDQRRGTNSQSFRIYNTYTDGSNYERNILAWSGSVFNIVNEAAGTGVVRPLNIQNILYVSGSRVGIGTTSPSASLDIRGIQTATGSIATTMLISSSLSASANNDVLVGLDINPTFTNGAFTGLDNQSLRITGTSVSATGDSNGIGAAIATFRNNRTSTTFDPVYIVKFNRQNSAVASWYFGNDANNNGVIVTNNSALRMGKDFGGTYTEYLRMFSNGNFLIQNGGTYTDAGYLLDVNGTVRSQGTLTVGTLGSGQINAATLNLSYPGNISYPTAYGINIIPSTAGSGVVVIDGSSMRLLANNHGLNLSTTTATKTFVIQKQQGGSDSTSYLNISGADQTNPAYASKGGPVRIYGGLHNGIQEQGLVVLAHNGTSTQGAVVVGGTSAHTSSLFDIQSTSRGFLPPRTNLTSNIATPAQGLMTYVNSGSNEGLYYYNSGSAVGWHKVVTNSGSQEISGSLNITGSLDVSGSVRISGQYTNKNGNDNSTAPIALRTIGNDNSGISIYKASFGHTNAIQFLSNDLTNRFSIGQGYIGVTNSLDFNIGRFASSAWSNAFTIFNATGNISINSTTDAGFKLDVNGTARVVNQATIQTLTVGLGGGAVSTNTAIGVSSLLSNTTGFDNSSFGWESLKSVTTGLFNSAFGVQALRSFVTGAHNSAFGNCALFSATGSRNSSLGSCAFYSLSSGNDNTSLGNNSGRYIAGGATANTTSNNSIFIGSDTKALADNQTNQIVIGYNETGLGSNTTIIGNSSTTLTALRGNVLINTTTDAGFKLDVNGTARVSGDLTVSSNTIVVGKGVSTGTFNTVLGTAPLGAGGGSSTCNYTVAVGRTAGYLCASGGANVMVGTEVAQLAPSISYSTLIGSKIFGSVTSSITQVLAIGTGDTNNYYPTIYATNIYSNSPNVRIGNNGGALASVPSAITASAILELSSTTKGFLPPRMTGAQAELISSPAEGLMVYSTDGTGVTITSKGWWGFDGATWVKFN